jgi:hypothetical protein
VFVTLRNGQLTIANSSANAWIAAEVIKVLRKARIKLTALPEDTPQLARRFVLHAHIKGDCRPRDSKSRARDEGQRQTAHLLLEAVKAASALAGKWVFITPEAIESASKYRFTSPEEITNAILALGEAARINAQGGLGVSWAAFMKRKGFAYSPNSSRTAMDMFRDQYHATVNGRKVTTPGHVCFGTGKPPYCARIYVHQPDKPGDPVVIGSVGPHLDIASRH